ncbi:hypothetical protein D9M72_476930 [compost metagenome]
MRVAAEGCPRHGHHREGDAPLHVEEAGVGAERDAGHEEHQDGQERPIRALQPPGHESRGQRGEEGTEERNNEHPAGGAYRYTHGKHVLPGEDDAEQKGPQ